MSDLILENNVAELLKRCHRTISDAQVERSLAAFERRMAAPRSSNRWHPAVAAALFVGLALWIAFKPKAPAPVVPQPAVRAPQPDPEPVPAPNPEPFPQDDDRSRLAQAEKLRQEGKFKEAIEIINGVLRNDPASTQALNQRAHTHLSAGDPSSAITDVNRLMEIHPNSVDCLWIRAEGRLALGDLEAALKDVNLVLKSYMWDQPYMTRAKIKLQLKDVQGAEADLANALKFTQDAGPIYLMRGDLRAEARKESLSDYESAARHGSYHAASLAAIGPKAVAIFKSGLDGASPQVATRILEGLKKYPEGSEVIRAYDEKTKEQLRLKKALDEEIARLIADLGGTDEVRDKAEARLLAIGRPALPLLAQAKYHEVPEARVISPRIAKTIDENARRDEQVAALRLKVAEVRRHWTARDFTDFEVQVLSKTFNRSFHYVPVKKIGSQFSVQSGGSDVPMVYRGKADLLTDAIVEWMDKNDGIAFVGMGIVKGPAGVPEATIASVPAAFGPLLVFSLPDKKGWSAYVVAYVPQ